MRAKKGERVLPSTGRSAAAGLGRERARLRAALEERRGEIEQAAATRVYAIIDPSEVSDPEYVDGLRKALTLALDHALEALERGEERAPPVPPALLAQARLAARHGVPVDTVLRRYFAGYSVLSEILLEAAEQGGYERGHGLTRLLRGQGAIFDRLLAAVSEEHRRETMSQASSREQRRRNRVKRLLAGEVIDVGDLNYDLDACHVGVVGSNHAAAGVVREVAKNFDKRLLLVTHGDGRIWAWFGAGSGSAWADLSNMVTALTEMLPPDSTLGIGDPAGGVEGWRVTHRQAAVALRAAGPVARYRDVGLVASVHGDELLSNFLRTRYLSRLDIGHDGGRTARETLQAYFTAERNVSSAAAALGVKRHTVRNRLRAIEKKLERPLNACYLELDVALRLETLVGSASINPPRASTGQAGR